jgi:polyphosphate glucokinase
MARILCFDIGGTAIKAMLFDDSGRALTERIRVPTPHAATPKAVLGVMRSIGELPGVRGGYSRISAGFPGVVKEGRTWSAPNLGPGWRRYPFRLAVERLFGIPVRVANDADIQGLGASRGNGLELTVTFGTGVGSALVYDGTLVPNLELGHHPFRRGQTYEEQLGKTALDEIGKRRWNARVRKMIRALSVAFNFDVLYLGGGNARHVSGKLPDGVRLVSNDTGLAGGVRLWRPRAREGRPRAPSRAL